MNWVLNTFLSLCALMCVHSQSFASTSVTVKPDGYYSIEFADHETFLGSVYSPITEIHHQEGNDSSGSFAETSFQSEDANSNHFSYFIRAYHEKSVVIFSVKFKNLPAKTARFPNFFKIRDALQILSYQHDNFAPAIFNSSGDAPWLMFSNAHPEAFILSPANHFMISNNFLSSKNEVSVGIESQVQERADDFEFQAVLAQGKDINDTYTVWGNALTQMNHKTSPANDSDPTLNTLGYWTDNQSSYWYNYDEKLGYANTLLAAKKEFASNGIPLGYLQLDSWWYLKGADANTSPPWTPSWDKSHYNHGIYKYEAAPELFPNGLASFQNALGLPLVTHARWIDPSSPYVNQYRMSNQVSIDPAYWEMIMSHLQNENVVVYEQDWLNDKALPRLDRIQDGERFLDSMSKAAMDHSVSLQYCMPLPRHFLQGSKYSNLHTIRPSEDGFEIKKWTQFLYGSRLASALGIWPWADVFFSEDKESLLIATLSGGMVGVGDRLSQDNDPAHDLNTTWCGKGHLPCSPLNRENLFHSIRADGVIVKPDTTLVPTSQAYVGHAGFKESSIPMTASATSHDDAGKITAAYVFSYSSTSRSQTLTLNPKDVGVVGDAYVYHYFEKTGELVPEGKNLITSVGPRGSYFIIVPTRESKMAWLGDLSLFASLGSKRIQIAGSVMNIHFAAGEKDLEIKGYAISANDLPILETEAHALVPVTYDSISQMFTIALHRDEQTSARLENTVRLNILNQ